MDFLGRPQGVSEDLIDRSAEAGILKAALCLRSYLALRLFQWT